MKAYESVLCKSFTNLCKWDSLAGWAAAARVESGAPESRALDRARGGIVDADGPGSGALRSSGCDDDSLGVPARLAGVGTGGVALGADRFLDGLIARPSGEAGDAECASASGAGVAGAASGGTGRPHRRSLCLRHRARRADDGGGLSQAALAGRGGVAAGSAGASAHAAAWLRVQAGERRA